MKPRAPLRRQSKKCKAALTLQYTVLDGTYFHCYVWRLAPTRENLRALEDDLRRKTAANLLPDVAAGAVLAEACSAMEM